TKPPPTTQQLPCLNRRPPEDLEARDLPLGAADSLPKLHGALLKNEQDVQLFEKLAFLSRRAR
ncbi:MAG: ATP-binding protein, partial [Albidovulum sp.]|nr:ATP-binding protein [Albidovulum sp.]